VLVTGKLRPINTPQRTPTFWEMMAENSYDWKPQQSLSANTLTGNIAEEKSLALKIAEGLIGTKYNSPLPVNEKGILGKLDCSGLVRYAMMQNPNISDPFANVEGNGVSRIMQKARQIEINDITNGDLLVIKSGNNENGHIGFIKDIVRDDNGNVTQYTLLHAEVAWTNASNGVSGGGYITTSNIIVGSGSGYSKSTYNHRFYQWGAP